VHGKEPPSRKSFHRNRKLGRHASAVIDAGSLSDVQSFSFEDAGEEILEVTPAKVRRMNLHFSCYRGETWWKHKQSKTVHLSDDNKPGAQIEPVSVCGRRMTKGFAKIDTLDDWASKYRVCFVGCRQPWNAHPLVALSHADQKPRVRWSEQKRRGAAKSQSLCWHSLGQC